MLPCRACRRRPLKQAIQECELRWFHETKALADEGDANQMALLGHMYTVGYGCKPDADEATKWFTEASKRLGYNVLQDQPPIMHPSGPPEPQQQPQQSQHNEQQLSMQHNGAASSSYSRYPTKQSISSLSSQQSQVSAKQKG